MENEMLNKETQKATGKVNVVVRDEFGSVKQDFTVDNLVVDSGLDFIASRMNGTSEAVMSHMAVGTDNTAAASTDTALQTELTRVALDSATVTNNAIEYVATFAAGTGTGALTEAGVLNNGTGGTLLCRTVFSVVNKGASDSMTITWTVTIS
jgi:hypothetical protein